MKAKIVKNIPYATLGLIIVNVLITARLNRMC